MSYEIWKPVIGFVGLYEVSVLGRVSCLNYRMKKGVKHILRPAPNSDGYLNVHLYAHDGGASYKVHRLVAEAFLPNPMKLPEVNHKNEVKSDNRVENLEWCAREYNMQYGTIADRNRARQQKRIIAKDPLTGKIVLRLPSIEASRKLGFDPTQVSRCCTGARGTKMHKNLAWSFDRKGGDVR